MSLLISVVSASSSQVSALSNDTLTCEHVREVQDKCQFVRDHCQEDRLGFFDYLEVYYCAASPVLSGFFLSGVVVWLCVLFMTIGIAASDYLCPNLNTISKMLGLSESLAGVTFLALGNGSPDVFSTYAAMKIGSGSLAIGELIGAASFITAVVTGSMAIIRPFKVARKSFLRDVIFFTVAVAFSMYFISDGVLKAWECATMLVIYTLYVVFVVVWHWYNSRKRHSYLVETRARDLYTELGHEVRIEADEEITDNPSLLTQGLNFTGFNSPDISPSSPLPNSPGSRNSVSPISPLTPLPAWQDQTEEDQEEAYNELTRIMRFRRNQRQFSNFQFDPSVSPSNSGSTSGPIIRPSLFGALEFRNVLQELGKSRAASAANIPLQAATSSDSAPTRSTASDSHLYPFRDDFNKSRAASHPTLPTYIDDDFSESSSRNVNVPHLVVTDVNDVDVVEPMGYSSAEYERAVSPDVDHYTDDPSTSFLSNVDSSDSYQSSRHQVLFAGSQTFTRLTDKVMKTFEGWEGFFTTLCPSLAGIRSKSWVNWIMCIATAPAIFLLTITVPVIESDAIEKEVDTSLEEEIRDPQPFLSPVKTKVYIPLTRWLLVIQALLGPLFVSWTGFADGDTSLLVLALYAMTASAVLLLLIFFLVPEATRAPIYMQTLSFAGFVFAISWVSLVANEVVGVLKALGLIFHISDAVLGLTVFAIGNSLGDLVANMTVAAMGFPMMALSACFGGPMLNILVGVGVSGLVVMPSSEGYHVELSNTIIISGITLLTTLIFLLVSVPFNNWRLSRTLGITTVLFWIIATTINVILEITIS